MEASEKTQKEKKKRYLKEKQEKKKDSGFISYRSQYNQFKLYYYEQKKGPSSDRLL